MFKNNIGDIGSSIYLINGLSDTKFIIKNSKFSDNRVIDKACIYSNSFSIDLIDSLFRNNSAISSLSLLYIH